MPEELKTAEFKQWMFFSVLTPFFTNFALMYYYVYDCIYECVYLKIYKLLLFQCLVRFFVYWCDLKHHIDEGSMYKYVCV